MSLQITINLSSGTPPYEQIRTQIIAHVSTARLKVGDRLPPIRTLASDLGVAAGTVARAYKELEAEGVVTTRRRAGTVISDEAVHAGVAAQQAAQAYVEKVRLLGLDDQGALDLVRGALLGPSNI